MEVLNRRGVPFLQNVIKFKKLSRKRSWKYLQLFEAVCARDVDDLKLWGSFFRFSLDSWLM